LPPPHDPSQQQQQPVLLLGAEWYCVLEVRRGAWVVMLRWVLLGAVKEKVARWVAQSR